MCVCVWVRSEVTDKGVMYFKKVNALERCEHVAAVGETTAGESRKGRRSRTLMAAPLKR